MKKILYFAAVVVLAFVGCSKSDDVNTQNEQFTITATIGDVNTRTSYTDETADATKGLKVEWEANEKITVVESINGIRQNVYQFTSTNSAGTTATFTAPTSFVKNDEATYMAFYPPMEECATSGHSDRYYSALPNGSYLDYMDHGYTGFRMDGTNKTIVNLELNNKMQQSSNNDMSHLKYYDLMISDVTFVSNNASIELKKQTALLKFNLTIPEEAKEFTAKYFKLYLPNGEVYYSKKSLSLEDGTMNNQASSADIIQFLGNFEGKGDYATSKGFTPGTTTLAIYRPVLFGKLPAGEYTIELNSEEENLTPHYYFATTTLEADMNIESGRVYVINATLSQPE